MSVAVDTSWLDFLEFVALRNDKHIYFRGHASKHYQLIPGIGRKDRQPVGGWSSSAEAELFTSFKREARRYEAGHGFSDLAWLAVAQHCGLPTRLLDWTTNPLVAAWFAVGNPKDDQDAAGQPVDARIHVIRADPSGIVDDDSSAGSAATIFGLSATTLVRLPAHAARITAQQGLFSLHGDPTKPWDPVGSGHVHETFDIPAASRPFFRLALHQFGVNDQRLMVDLDGLCRTLGWAFANGR